MIAKARQTIDQQYFDEKRIQIVHGSYADFGRITQQTGVQQVDYILIDIGVNMEHFKDASRGFSIKHDGPLDMRYDTSQ
jgi:16S rRNA (cytosine1402-N4)-methyltransferase